MPEADIQADLGHLRGESPIPIVGHDSVGQPDDILAVDLVGL
jgi:hypothetical protein